MKYSSFGIAVGLILLVAAPAFAQAPSPPIAAPTDWQSYAQLLQQQRDRESARANNFEVEIAVSNAHAAALAKYWGDYVKGLQQPPDAETKK